MICKSGKSVALSKPALHMCDRTASFTFPHSACYARQLFNLSTINEIIYSSVKITSFLNIGKKLIESQFYFAV